MTRRVLACAALALVFASPARGRALVGAAADQARRPRTGLMGGTAERLPPGRPRSAQGELGGARRRPDRRGGARWRPTRARRRRSPSSTPSSSARSACLPAARQFSARRARCRAHAPQRLRHGGRRAADSVCASTTRPRRTPWSSGPTDAGHARRGGLLRRARRSAIDRDDARLGRRSQAAEFAAPLLATAWQQEVLQDAPSRTSATRTSGAARARAAADRRSACQPRRAASTARASSGRCSS